MTFAEIGCEQSRLVFKGALTVGSHQLLEPFILGCQPLGFFVGEEVQMRGEGRASPPHICFRCGLWWATILKPPVGAMHAPPPFGAYLH